MPVTYDDEEWADILDYPNYMISNHGRIWNIKYDRLLKPSLDRYGYEYVCLYRNGESENKWIARLVAIAFLYPVLGSDLVNHDDGNKRHNHVDNLEWCTLTENRRHAFRTGLQTPPNKKPVRVIETGDVFESLTDCARSIKGHHSAISLCLSGKRNHHAGYTFEYVEKEALNDPRRRA